MVSNRKYVGVGRGRGSLNLRRGRINLGAKVECDHCGYINLDEAVMLIEVGVMATWVCPACAECNTTHHKAMGFVTKLGYQRNLEVDYEYS